MDSTIDCLKNCHEDEQILVHKELNVGIPLRFLFCCLYLMKFLVRG